MKTYHFNFIIELNWEYLNNLIKVRLLGNLVTISIHTIQVIIKDYDCTWSEKVLNNNNNKWAYSKKLLPTSDILESYK